MMADDDNDGEVQFPFFLYYPIIRESTPDASVDTPNGFLNMYYSDCDDTISLFLIYVII